VTGALATSLCVVALTRFTTLTCFWHHSSLVTCHSSLIHFATHHRLKRPNVVRFRRRLRRLQQAYASGSISLDKASESIQSWCAHAAHGNTYRLRNQILRQSIFRPARI